MKIVWKIKLQKKDYNFFLLELASSLVAGGETGQIIPMNMMSLIDYLLLTFL